MDRSDDGVGRLTSFLRVLRRDGPVERHPSGYSVRRMASGGHARLIVRGEADCAAAAEIGEAILLTLADRPARLTIDLRGVTFADSSFLKVLLGGKTAADSAGVPIALLLTTGGPVERMFALTGLTDHFATAPATTGVRSA